MDTRLTNRKLMENFTKKLTTEVGGGKNPDADREVVRLISKFIGKYGISAPEAADVIKSSLKRLGYK